MIAVVGAIMIIYVLVGGMKGTTWVQIIKAVLLVVGAGVMTVWVLAKYTFNLSSLLGAAVDKSPAAGEKLLEPGSAVRRRPGSASWTSSHWRSRWCSVRRACRTC